MWGMTLARIQTVARDVSANRPVPVKVCAIAIAEAVEAQKAKVAEAQYRRIVRIAVRRCGSADCEAANYSTGSDQVMPKPQPRTILPYCDNQAAPVSI